MTGLVLALVLLGLGLLAALMKAWQVVNRATDLR